MSQLHLENQRVNGLLVVRVLLHSRQDCVRLIKLALNNGIGGPLEGPSSYLMKSPPVQVPDSVAREDTESFIAEHGGAPKLPGKGKIAAKT